MGACCLTALALALEAADMLGPGRTTLRMSMRELDLQVTRGP